MLGDDDVEAVFDSWANVPSALLERELRRRQAIVASSAAPAKPACGTKGAQGAYDTGMHVFALVLILALSTAACAFPIIVRRFPTLAIPPRVLFLSRHFGTGVLIATAFVHLLPTAFVSMTDPCLPDFWNRSYPAMPGFIAMTSVLIVVGIEMFFAMRGAGHVHATDYEQLDGDISAQRCRPRPVDYGAVEDDFRRSLDSPPMQDESLPLRRLSESALLRLNAQSSNVRFEDASPRIEHDIWGQEAESPLPPNPHTVSPLPVSSSSESDLALDELDELDPTENRTGHSNNVTGLQHPQPTRPLKTPLTSSPPLTPSLPRSPPLLQVPSRSPMPGLHSAALTTPLSPRSMERKLLLQVLLLEAGILFHSIFIGIALSVTTGPPFLVLLIAISFHQTFEGLALGARIASIPTLRPTSPKPWLMACAYGATTPLGQAIGLAVHGLYDPKGQTGLLVVGGMNAVSSGLLLFAGLVELLAEDFLSDASYMTLRGRRRLEACAAVVGGALLMALVGAFA